MALVTNAEVCKEVDLKFEACVQTHFGDRVVVVGSHAALGFWDPYRSRVELHTGPKTYPRWTGSVANEFFNQERLDFKFVIVRPGGEVIWETGPNRTTSCWMDLKDMKGSYDLAASRSRAVDDLSCSSPERLTSVLSHPGLFSLKQNADTGLALIQRDSTFEGDDSFGTTSDDHSPFMCNFTSFSMEETDPSRSIERKISDISLSSSSLSNPFLQFWAGACRRPKPEGNCEDAFFYGTHALGVADGVGSMVHLARYGVDAAAYANELMENTALALRRSASEDETSLGDRLMHAVAKAEAEAITYGASTVTVLALQGRTVATANLGDCGFVLLRPSSCPCGKLEIVEQSFEMNHAFNRPYQLTRIPDVLQPAVIGRLDTAEDLEQHTFEARPGDLILVFSDGVSDNLHMDEMISIVAQTVESFSNNDGGLVAPDTIAEAVVRAAKARSLEDRTETPFTKKALIHQIHHPGGKIDDCTAVAAWIVPDSDQDPGLLQRSISITCSDPFDPSGSRIL